MRRSKRPGGGLTWLGAECRDGKAKEAERGAAQGEGRISQSLHSTAGQDRDSVLTERGG
jgi:hypothetical protein